MPPRPVKPLRKVQPPPKDRTDFICYKKFLYKKTNSFPCPHCSSFVLPKDYEKHCKKLHTLDTLYCCAWCFGNKTWPSKCKCEHAIHLMECARHFLTLHAPPPLQTFVSSAFDRRPLCPSKHFFDRTPDPQPRAYEPIWPMPLSPNPIRFDTDSLNRATSCVRTYLDLGKDAEWHHVIVRSIAFQSFLEAMDSDEGRTRTLSFSCWCDGGKYEEARHRQHRHLITVSPPSPHFERNVWKKIKIDREDRPGPRFRIIHKQPIHSALHLVHTLGYLSQRESVCDFSGDDPHSPETPNHYYCFESLPRDYRLPLVLQWEGGLQEHLNLEFRNLKWGDLMHADLTFVRGKWRLLVQNIPGIRFGLVLPVAPDTVPSLQPTDRFLHLLNGRKLYFKDLRRSGRSNAETWLREQADMTFYETVGDDAWTPRPFHQKLLNEFKPLVERNTQLESKVAALQKEGEALQLETVAWRAKHEVAEQRVQSLQEKNDELNDRVVQMTLKIVTLNDKIHWMNEGEIARLNRELAETKRKCKELEKRNAELAFRST